MVNGASIEVRVETSIPLVARGGMAITDEIEFERLIR
jgi:hypothetical protein